MSDNLTGLTGAWHWTEKREWQKIDLLREVYRDGEFALTFTLHGIGDVQFDDLELIAHELPEEPPLALKSVGGNGSATKPGKVDFWQRLPLVPFPRK